MNRKQTRPAGVDRMTWREYTTRVAEERNPVRRKRLAEQYGLPYIPLAEM